MKICFISDIHGVPDTLELFLKHAKNFECDKIVLLGDVLYHGPRNGVPCGYDPKKVSELLNEVSDKILAVRGNCDTEVDQMMLNFPIMSRYSELLVDDKHFFLTHGHVWNEDNMPPLGCGTIIVHGHTHIPVLKEVDGCTIFNPGSLSLPKGGFCRSFGYFDGTKIDILNLDTLESILDII